MKLNARIVGRMRKFRNDGIRRVGISYKSLSRNVSNNDFVDSLILKQSRSMFFDYKTIEIFQEH